MTKLNLIEDSLSGNVMARFVKDKDVDGIFHRTTFCPGMDVAEQMSAVNSHLTKMGCGVVGADDIAIIQSKCAEVWTPEVIAAHLANNS